MVTRAGEVVAGVVQLLQSPKVNQAVFVEVEIAQQADGDIERERMQTVGSGQFQSAHLPVRPGDRCRMHKEDAGLRGVWLERKPVRRRAGIAHPSPAGQRNGEDGIRMLVDYRQRVGDTPHQRHRREGTTRLRLPV